MRKTNQSAVAVLAAALALAAFWVFPAAAETRYGLFVGINEFDYVRSLKSCDWDAACMCDAWTTSGGCAQENVSLFANLRATKSAVREKFAEIAEKAEAGDTVMYCQSSHGGTHLDDLGDDTKNAYLCMTDGYYEDYEFAEDLLKFADGVRVVVLIDACNSGGMFKSDDADGSESLSKASGATAKRPGWNFASRVCKHMEGRRAMRRGVGGGPQVAFITSADWNESSTEIISDRHGELTLAILKGWADGEADYDLDGGVTFGELAAYAADSVESSSVQFSNSKLLETIDVGGKYDRNEFRLVCPDGFLAGFYGTCPAHVDVPDGVVEIGWSAFDCRYNDAFGLESATFPASLQRIDGSAFYGCGNFADAVFMGDFDAIDCTIWAFQGAPVRGTLFAAKNDAFADAIELAGQNGWINGSNIGATRTDEIDELTRLGSATVWWTWTAPSSGICTFDTFGSGFDTRLAILAQSDDGFVPIAENDDSPYAYLVGESEVTFAIEMGVTYCIGVSGYKDERDGIALAWATHPKNDDFANAFALQGESGTAEGWNHAATRLDPIDKLTSLDDATVWWTWTAPCSGDCTFDTFGSHFDTIISVLARVSGEDVRYAVVAENDDVDASIYGESAVTFAADEGVAYCIGVSGYSDDTGDIVLNWSLATPGDDPEPEPEPKPEPKPESVVAVVDFDPTGTGNTIALELVLGEPYRDALAAVEPETTRHGQVFAGWLVNGVPLSPDMVVCEGDTITASWRELAYNPLCPSETEAADTSIANVYDGYVLDKAGVSVGTVHVKIGKANARSHQSAASATAQLLGRGKVSGFKAKDGGKVDFSAGSLGTTITLVKPGQADMVVTVGHDGLSGAWGEYIIAGVRNTSKKDAAGYAPWIGVYDVAFKTQSASGGGAAFADGYSFASVSVAAKGKVKVTGSMADGAKINCSGQLLVAEGGNEACVNVIAPMYAGKTGGVGFVLWISKDGSATVESVGEWTATGKEATFSAKLLPVGAAKLATPPAALKFAAEASLPDKIGDADVLGEFLPANVSVAMAGGTSFGSSAMPGGKFIIAKPNKIKADGKGGVAVTGNTDNDAGLKLNYTAKTGAFRGSFRVCALNGGKLKKFKATVAGGFVGNSGYGSAVVKGVAAIPIRLTAD